MFGPFDHQHAFVAHVVEAELRQLRRLVDPVKIDVPYGRRQRFIWLDDGEAGTWYFAPMTQRGKQTADQGRLSRRKGAREGYHVAWPEGCSKLAPKLHRFRFACQDHRG